MRQSIGIFTLGVFAAVGFYWQYRLCKNDFSKKNTIPLRVKIALALCGLLTVGVIVKSLIAIYIDENLPYSGDDIANNIKNTILFSIQFSIKAYFGPIVTMGSIAIATYYFVEYGNIDITPFLSTMLDVMMSFTPIWTERLYSIIITTYIIVTSCADTVSS